MFRYNECKSIQWLLWDYVAGLLEEGDGQRVKLHLGSCAACSKSAESMQRTILMLHSDALSSAATPIPNWGDVADRLAQRQVTHLPLFPARVGAVALAMAACAITFVLWLNRAPHHAASNLGSAKPRNADKVVRRAPKSSPKQVLVNSPEQLSNFPQHRSTERDLPSPGSSDTATIGPRSFANDDMAFLNAPAESVFERWTACKPNEVAAMQARVDEAIRRSGKGDDFVNIAFPMIASTDRESVRAAARVYQKEKEIVDARLSKNATIAAKAQPLEDLCRLLTQRSGIDLKADRSVADEKVTLFCEETPLREVMRQINRLFGFQWERSGSEGSYSYVLAQSLRSKLAEEEMRNHDTHEALIALDEKLRQNFGHIGTDQGHKWAGSKAYELLSPEDRAALANGDQIELSPDSENAGRRIPDGLRSAFLRASGYCLGTWGGRPVISSQRRLGDEPFLADMQDASPSVYLRIDRSEAGEMSLMIDELASIGSRPDLGRARIGILAPVASASSPSSAAPDNAQLQASLKSDPSFKKIVSITPVSSCPHYGGTTRDELDEDQYIAESVAKDGPHVLSCDVWEAVHKATHMPVIADAYSRYYRTEAVSTDNGPLFDAICKMADAMGVKWKKDGDFLAARSARFVWDKVKEVPERLLSRWRTDARKGYVPLDDLLEMASLSDQQLGSTPVGKVIEHCCGVREWGMVGNGHPRVGMMVPARILTVVRFIGALNLGQRGQAMSEAGLSVGSLRQDQIPLAALAFPGYVSSGRDPQQAQPARRPAPQASPSPSFRTDVPPGARQGYALGGFGAFTIHFNYAPAGSYVWHPVVKSEEISEALKIRLIAAKTEEEALAYARRHRPATGRDQIHKSNGEIFVWLTDQDGRTIPFMTPVQIAAD